MKTSPTIRKLYLTHTLSLAIADVRRPAAIARARFAVGESPETGHAGIATRSCVARPAVAHDRVLVDGAASGRS